MTNPAAWPPAAWLIAWIAAVLLVLAAAVAAFVALRSRRRRQEEVSEDAYYTEPEQAYVEPEPEPAPTVAAPVPANETAREMIGTEELAPATAPMATAAAEREPAAMPVGPVPRGEARDRLLEQMVAAAPDDANPFRSRKARLRRARIILQSLEQKQKDSATEPFDWRTYKPSTSHPAPATPPRVTA